ncbi:MAG: hypothetical protein Ta2C_03120 [Candidatus Endomicrobiellum trichonymphae]|uniref:hypothetical protein n=1 Tax=Endomicrobium trichonymphae TaxID=1408204 RepID=UPI0027D38648|nr:MAG: hypothetical protein Ta2C_03120 [Candidatus Endomicrobium trichonymphae]
MDAYKSCSFPIGVEVVAPKEIWGKTIKNSSVISNYGVNIIAMRKRIPIIDDDGQSDIKEERMINE